MNGIVVALAGGTGLVGSALLRILLEDTAVERVIAPTRRPLSPHPKLDNPSLIGPAWPALPRLDEAYGALGTTRKDAGSAAAFRVVDLDLALSFAKAAREAGARRFGLVSSVGADPRSRFLYPRTKGEAELAVAAQRFEAVVLARPSLLLGERARPRGGERIAEVALGALSPVLRGPFRKYRAISAHAVAAALIAAVRGAVPGTIALESDVLAAMARGIFK